MVDRLLCSISTTSSPAMCLKTTIVLHRHRFSEKAQPYWDRPMRVMSAGDQPISVSRSVRCTGHSLYRRTKASHFHCSRPLNSLSCPTLARIKCTSHNPKTVKSRPSQSPV
jgi:hypothetical protein